MVVAIVLRWEKQPLGSLWLQPLRWQSVVWGLLLAAVYYSLLLPLGEWVRRSAGLPGFAGGMEDVMRFPVWYRAIAVIGAGVIEEILFRGYSVTRLAMLTGHIWLGAAVSLCGFYALHVPAWGWGFAVGGLVSGAGAMAFFLWRKDLLAMVVFHLTTDAIGLVIVPSFTEWWKKPAWF
jgi:uncharacterized protein